MIESKKFPKVHNNFYAGNFLTKNGTAEQLVGSCLLDKLASIVIEDGINTESHDLKADLASCCTKGDTKSCEADLNGSYAAIIEAQKQRRIGRAKRRQLRRSRAAMLSAWRRSPKVKAIRAKTRTASRLGDESWAKALGVWRKTKQPALDKALKDAIRARRKARHALLKKWRDKVGPRPDSRRERRRHALLTWRNLASTKKLDAQYKAARHAQREGRRNALKAWRKTAGAKSKKWRVRRRSRNAALDKWHASPEGKRLDAARTKARRARRQSRSRMLSKWRTSAETRSLEEAWRLRDRLWREAVRKWRKSPATKKMTSAIITARNARLDSREATLQAWRKQPDAKAHKLARRAGKKEWRVSRNTALKAWHGTVAKKLLAAVHAARAVRAKAKLTAMKGVLAATQKRLNGAPLTKRALKLLIGTARRCHNVAAAAEFKKQFAKAQGAFHFVVKAANKARAATVKKVKKMPDN